MYTDAMEVFQLNRLAELRKRDNLTLRELSQKLLDRGIHVSNQNLSNWERDKRPGYPKLSEETWAKFADIFDVTIAYIQGVPGIKSYEQAKLIAHERAVKHGSELFSAYFDSADLDSLPDNTKAEMVYSLERLNWALTKLALPNTSGEVYDSDLVRELRDNELAIINRIQNLITLLSSTVAQYDSWKSWTPKPNNNTEIMKNAKNMLPEILKIIEDTHAALKEVTNKK